MSQETAFGVFYVGLPEEVIKSLRAISEKTGKSVVECLSDAVYELEKKNAG